MGQVEKVWDQQFRMELMGKIPTFDPGWAESVVKTWIKGLNEVVSVIVRYEARHHQMQSVGPHQMQSVGPPMPWTPKEHPKP